MSKVKWTDALLSTATIDLNYAQPGKGANAPRSQAEFPHELTDRMVSLTNASVIPSLFFVVVLDFRS